MSLRQQQDLLARLYTDNELRLAFLKEPALFAERLGVSSAEAEVLAAVSGDEVEWFSESLVSKRLREVRKMLPMTEEQLGSKRFAERFRVFADQYSARWVKKHLEDSLAFADVLVRDRTLDPSERGIVRFESRRLRHNALDQQFSFCLLRYDPRRAIAYENHQARLGVGFWIAIGRWSRIFFRADGIRQPHP